MNELSWVAVPFLVAFGGLATWFVQSRVEEARAIERRLADDRRDAYRRILEPYLTIFSGLNDPKSQQDSEGLFKGEYRRAVFDLNLMGSDDVIRSFNELMQFFYNADQDDPDRAKETMRLWGSLLLEIRKSVGNSGTHLNEVDMLRGLITDIDKILARQP